MSGWHEDFLSPGGGDVELTFERCLRWDAHTSRRRPYGARQHLIHTRSHGWRRGLNDDARFAGFHVYYIQQFVLQGRA